MDKQKIILKDGRTGIIESKSQNGCVLVTFPYFVVNEIVDIPPPSEIKDAFKESILIDALTEDSRLVFPDI